MQGHDRWDCPDGTLPAVGRGCAPLLACGKEDVSGRAQVAHFRTGKCRFYDRFYLGYEERIRGHFRQVAEGDSMVIVASELRFTLIPVIYFQLRAAEGLLSNYSRSLKFGVNAGLFCEAGSVWFR